MNGLKDFVVCARDGLCGGYTRSRPRGGRGLGARAACAEEEDRWDAWPGEEPAPPPIPKVIHVTTTEDADDDLLLGLDFVDGSASLPPDLFLTEPPPSSGYSLRRSGGGLANTEMDGRRVSSSASSLSASTDTGHAQIFHAWTGSAACISSTAAKPTARKPNVITTMAYVFPLRKEHVQVGSDVDGSSYSSLDCGHYWLTRSAKASLRLSHHPKSPTTPPTEASSVASF